METLYFLSTTLISVFVVISTISAVGATVRTALNNYILNRRMTEIYF